MVNQPVVNDALIASLNDALLNRPGETYVWGRESQSSHAVIQCDYLSSQYVR